MSDATKARSFELYGVEGNRVCLAPDPLGVLMEDHALQSELCDVLENIADGLPRNFNHGLVAVAISILESGLPAHMQFEEEALFPLLLQRVPIDDPIRAAVTCLEREHERDGALLFEVTETLRAAMQNSVPQNPEMLGYLLRCFFESQRRHIAWENSFLLPAAREFLNTEDHAVLQRQLMKSSYPRCSHQSIVALRVARSSMDVCESCPSFGKC